MSHHELQQKLKESVLANPRVDKKIEEAKNKGKSVLKYLSVHPIKSLCIGFLASWVVKKCLL